MIEMYFAVKTVNGFEGFIYSIDEFLGKYKNSYMINDLRSAKYYAIYQIDHCDNCKTSYEVIISSRKELMQHLKKFHGLCNACMIFKASAENNLGFKLQ